MPRLSNQHFRHEGRDGTVVEFDSKVFVDPDGTSFKATFPRTLMAFAYALLETEPWLRSGERLALRGTRDHAWLEITGCTSVRQCQQFIDAVIAESLHCTETREAVIAYRANSNYSFWQDPDGTLHPSGDPAYAASEGNWVHAGLTKHSQQFSDEDPRNYFFHVGFAACVIWKVTLQRQATTSVRYERYRCPQNQRPGEKHPDLGEIARKLNGFPDMAIDLDRIEDDYKLMPYSEAAAEFFYNAIMTICRLGHSLDKFIADEKRVLHAIETRCGNPLLAP